MPLHINGQTKLVGLMGYSVEHSFSPIMHNSAFAALNLNWCYVPLPVRPQTGLRWGASFLSTTTPSISGARNGFWSRCLC